MICNTVIYYAILTVDVLLADEAGQVSSEQLATIDIRLHKLRN